MEQASGGSQRIALPAENRDSEASKEQQQNTGLQGLFFKQRPHLLRVADFLVRRAIDLQEKAAPDLAVKLFKDWLLQRENVTDVDEAEFEAQLSRTTSIVQRQCTKAAKSLIKLVFPLLSPHEDEISLSSAIALSQKYAAQEIHGIVRQRVRDRMQADAERSRVRRRAQSPTEAPDVAFNATDASYLILALKNLHKEYANHFLASVSPNWPRSGDVQKCTVDATRAHLPLFLKKLEELLREICSKVLLLDRERRLSDSVVSLDSVDKKTLAELASAVASVGFIATVFAPSSISLQNVEKSVNSVYNYFRQRAARHSGANLLVGSLHLSVSSQIPASSAAGDPLTASGATLLVSGPTPIDSPADSGSSGHPPASPSKRPTPSPFEKVRSLANNIIDMLAVIFLESSRLVPLSASVVGTLMASNGYSSLTSPLLGLMYPSCLSSPDDTDEVSMNISSGENLARVEEARKDWLKHFTAISLFLLSRDAIRVAHIEQSAIQLLSFSKIRPEFQPGIWGTLMAFIEEYHSAPVAAYLGNSEQYSLSDFACMLSMPLRWSRVSSSDPLFARLKVVFKRQFELGIFTDDSWMRRSES